MRRVFFVTWLVLLGSGAGWAQTAALGPAESVGQVTFEAERSLQPGSNWGTSDRIVATTVSPECGMVSPSMGWDYTFGGARYSTGFFVCGVHLPAGASIQRIELQGCDTSTTAEVEVILGRISGNSNPVEVGRLNTGVPTASGCGWYAVTLTPYTVDNYHESYFFEVHTWAGDPSTAFVSVRVYYNLQVSPAPATASFPNDVPTTHPFFRFIEALASAGITGGCGTNSFCPDQAITRGQMAVFLSSALGLHYPN